MENAYQIMKDKHRKEFIDFPCFFAYSHEQFVEGMAKFCLLPDDTDKIFKMRDTGGFYLRTDAMRLFEMISRHDKEMQDAIYADITGEGFIFDMFSYVLSSHEFTITGDVEYTFDSLDLTWIDIEMNDRLRHGLELAKKYQYEQIVVT